MSESAMQAPPVSHETLQEIAENACNTALASASSYTHSDTESWNTHIINTILSSLLASAPPTPQYKYAVNSTIIQHLDLPTTSKTSSSTTQTGAPSSLNPLPAIASALGANEASGRDTEAPVLGTSSDESRHGGASGSSTKPEKGRRGMHSATGAYWNNATDGMWSWKYEGGEAKGMDVVVSVIWIAIA